MSSGKALGVSDDVPGPEAGGDRFSDEREFGWWHGPRKGPLRVPGYDNTGEFEGVEGWEEGGGGGETGGVDGLDGDVVSEGEGGEDDDQRARSRW